MTRLLRYEPPPAKRIYVAPRGTDPVVFMRELGAQAEVLIRDSDFSAALRLLQRRLAVISYYRGSRTQQAAQAMASLARLSAKMNNTQDAETWAHYALRAYAALLTDAETRNKSAIVESMSTLHEAFPDAAVLEDFERSGAPDYTTGTLVQSNSA